MFKVEMNKELDNGKRHLGTKNILDDQQTKSVCGDYRQSINFKKYLN